MPLRCRLVIPFRERTPELALPEQPRQPDRHAVVVVVIVAVVVVVVVVVDDDVVAAAAFFDGSREGAGSFF